MVHKDTGHKAKGGMGWEADTERLRLLSREAGMGLTSRLNHMVARSLSMDKTMVVVTRVEEVLDTTADMGAVGIIKAATIAMAIRLQGLGLLDTSPLPLKGMVAIPTHSRSFRTPVDNTCRPLATLSTALCPISTAQQPTILQAPCLGTLCLLPCRQAMSAPGFSGAGRCREGQ